MHILREYLFLIPVVVLFLTEAAKLGVEWWRTGGWQHRIFHPGGMPSSHSAFVTSLLIIVWRRIGSTSPEFAISFVFACVVWYDAMSARRALGEQARVLNQLQKWQHFTEQLGHSFAEVLVGVLFGAGITLLGIWVS